MPHSDSPFEISAKDVLDTLRRHKRTLFLCSCLAPLIILASVLIRPPSYKAEATFREKGKAQNEITRGSGLALLAGLNENNENTANSLFNSKTLLGAAIVQKSKQAVIESSGFSLAWIKNAYRNLQAEYAALLDKPYPVLADNDFPFEIQGLKYLAETPLKLKINFLSENRFHISFPDKQILSGELNKPLNHDKFSLTLVPTGGALSHRSFIVTLNPLEVAYQKVKAKFFVQSDHKDKGLLKLSFKDPNRKEASSFLNAVLASYQEHQRKEHERICQEQLIYLNNRQIAAGAFLEGMMVKHAQTMSLEGPTIDLLFQNQQAHLQKLLSIDLESNRLQSALSEGRVFYDSLGLEGGGPGVINQLLGEMRTLKQHGDAIQLALDNQRRPASAEKAKGALQEYQGIDLASANQLFLDYSARLNETEGEINHHQFLAQQVQSPEFEVSSLSTVLNDPVSHEIIQKASRANLLLQDQDNRSGREQERLKGELALQKGVLKTHIEQTKELLQLKKGLLQEKIWGLQNTQLELIRQKVAVLELQLRNYLLTRIENLKQEREVIENQQALLREEMMQLPAKWASEKMIEQHLETSKKMIEKIAEAIEAKNISAKLDLSQASPLDRAVPPMNPQSPLLLMFAVLGSFAGLFLSSGFVLIRQALAGFPARRDNLPLHGQIALGNLSPQLPKILGDEDLEVLRRLAGHIEKSKVVALLLNQGPDYSGQLAELLTKGGRKVIILSCLFDGSEAQNHAAGLLQYLAGDPLETASWISSGGFTRYGKEALETPRFKELLSRLTLECDCLLLVSRCPILSAEGDLFFQLADQCAVTLNGESLRALTPLFKHHPLFLGY